MAGGRLRSAVCRGVHSRRGRGRRWQAPRPGWLPGWGGEPVPSGGGVLAVYKRPGVTAAGVVQRVRDILEWNSGQPIKVGHGGTLDPMARGVLVLGVAAGTKRIGDYLAGSKAYWATGELGTATDTLDSDTNSTVTHKAPWQHLDLAALRAAAEPLQGEILQTPPLYSAVRVGGKRLHALARAGATEASVPRLPRPVTVHELEVLECGPGGEPVQLPSFGLRCRVGGGTYVRSLVDQLGRNSGSVAHMTSLLREEQGDFGLGDCLEWDPCEPRLDVKAPSGCVETLREAHRGILKALRS